jgi:hypothetical protein
MRVSRFLLVLPILGFAAGVLMTPKPAEAKCLWFKASHNGTDFFYSDGAAGTAEWKLMDSIGQWKAAHRIKRVKIRKSKTRCGDWFIKYALPHKNCVAKARVCY